MAIKGLQSKQLANNPSTPAPKFNFRKYSTDATFVNNSENIDFVTYDGSLYVCTSSTPIQPTHADPIENGGFLLVVAKGEDGKQGKQGKDGADGKMPQIGARFNGGQLEIFDSTGTRLTTSPDLTGKIWKPVQEGSTLSGELSKSNSVPSDIDLEQLRPVEEKPLLLRVDSDNTKRSDEESGPANMIQWKHEGDEHWTNLISISELMNIALAGVSFGVDEQTNEGHFGHKKVISATYDSHKDGEKIISNVELGEVLFDAGALPFMNYELDFNTLLQRISDVENALNSLGSIDLSNYVLKDRLATINNQRLDTGINFNLPTDFSGLTDIQIQIYNDKLQYRKAVNGTYEQQGTDVLDLSNIGEGDTSNGFVNARIEGTNLVLIRQDNTTLSIPLPSGGGPNVDLSNYVTKPTFNLLQSRIDDLVSNGFYIKLKIENSKLFISYNNGAVNSGKEVGFVGGGSSSNINGSDLLFSSETVTNYETGAVTYKLKVKKGSSANYEEIYSVTLQDWVTTTTFNTQITAINDRIDSLAGGDFNVTTFRTFLVYTWYNGAGSPSLPESCSGDTTNNVLTLPVNTIGHESPGNVPSTGTGYKLWMSSATLKSDGTAINSTAGTAPVCLTADPGNPGKDGNGVEFIFTLIRDINDKQSVLTPVAPVGQGDDDIPNGGEDHPQGIGFYNVGTDDFTTVLSNLPNGETLFGIELASMRTYNGDTGQGSSYYPPFIGSKGGENGIDGDGIEYIYRLAGTDDVTLNNATGEITLNNTNNTVYPPLASDLVNPPAHYQHSDWVPGWTEGNDPNSDGLTGNGGYSDPGWDRNGTDEPLSVNRTTPYEFVSIRKYNGTTETGGPFSTPVLWNRYVTDGETVYTSYIFTRTSTPNFTSAELTGGPEPENVVTRLNGDVLNDIEGSDTVPQGSAPVYMSYNLIGDTTDTGGSSPSPIGDTPFIQVEFSAEENAKTNYTLPNLNTIENGVQIFIDDTQEHGINETLMRQRAGLKDVNDPTSVVGGDENDISDPIGMATAVRNGGTWSGGTYAKIKGEPGAKGENGHAFTTRTSFVVNETNYKLCSGDSSLGALLDSISNPQVGDAAMIQREKNGTVYSTEIGAYTGEDPSVCDINSGLVHGGRLSGTLIAGSSYIHQKFANADVNGTLLTVVGEDAPIRLTFTSPVLPTFTNPGEFPGKYVGMYVDNIEDDSNDIEKYTGAKGSGDDGFGMEQIFILSETKPVRPILSNASGNNQATIYCNGLTIDGVSVVSNEITQKYYEYNAVPTIVDATVSPNKVYTGNDRPQQPRRNVPCWVSVRKLNSVSLKEGSDPIEYDRYARDGQDGDFKEYVYHLYDIELTAQQLDPKNSQYVLNSSYGKVSGSNTITDNPDQKDFLPGDSQGTNPTGFGTDNPVGVDDTHQCEYVSTRDITYNSNNEPIFDEFSVPVLWSRFGQQGKDGDGLEYVFFPVSATIHNLIQANNNGKITVVNKTDSDFAEHADIDPLTHQPKDYDTEDEVCPKGRYTNGAGGTSYLSSVDDNPGITDTNPYVYASKRKYKGGDTGKGEPFRDATLWTGMDPTLKKTCVLSVGNDNEPVGIDSENNHVRDEYKSINFDTGWLELRDLEGDLKRIDTLYLNNIEFFNITNGINGQVTNVNNASVSINVDNGTLTITPYGGYVSEHFYYSCVFKLIFTPNNGNNFTTFSNRVLLNLTAKNSDGYYGSATLTLTPETSKYIVKELSENVALIRKSNKDATDYNPSSLSSAVYINKNTGLDTMKNVVVGVQFDDDPQHTIDVALGYYVDLATGGDNTTFKYRPVNANGDGHGNALTYGSDGTDIFFYFDENGNRLSNQNNAVLAVRFYNCCEHKDHDEYACYFNVYLNNLDYVITDNLRLRVGYNPEANYGSNNYENDITDESYIAVVYPGKDGQPGQPGEPGKYKKELYCLGTENTYDGKGQSSYASSGATISTLTSSPNAGSETKSTVTSSKPHIWMTRADVTIGSESTQTCIGEEPTRITPVDGNVTHTYQYLDGTIMRTSVGSEGTTDSTKYGAGETRVLGEGSSEHDGGNEGIKYLDVVSIVSNGKTSGYKCIQNHAKRSTDPATDTSYGAEFSIMGDAAFHNLLVENAAYIESLTSKQVVITDGTGANTQIVAGMASGSDIASASGNQTVGNVRIWAGTPTTSGDLRTAPFTVDNTGKLISDDAEITGEIHAESGSIDGTLTIGADGELVSSITTSDGVVQTTVSATEIKNSYTDNSTYAFETKIAEGKINVYNDFAGDKLRSQLGPDDLQFYSQQGSGGVTITEAVTTPIIQNGVYAGSAFAPIFHIVQVTALPADPDPATLYIIVS